MNLNTPLVSIILPAYNAEKYISEAIESVINQTYSYWELLVVNDGSVDNTSNIVSSFAEERIQLIEQNNCGVSSARNKGLSQVKGKYITFLDADDLLPTDSLMARVNYLESNPNIDLVDGKIIGKDIDMNNDIRIYEPYYTGMLLPLLVALDDRVFCGICYMFKTAVLGDVRFAEKMTHAEDLLFYTELSNQTPIQYGFVSTTVYCYRSGHVSAMTNLDGLEKGYLLLLSKVNKLKNVSFSQNFKMRLKIARILFLSWLKQKDFFRAFKSIFLSMNIY